MTRSSTDWFCSRDVPILEGYPSKSQKTWPVQSPVSRLRCSKPNHIEVFKKLMVGTSVTRGVAALLPGRVSKLLLLISLVLAPIGLVACGSDDPAVLPLPTATAAATEAPHQLVVYAPFGGRLIYSWLETAMKARGLAYNVKILEGVTTDLTIQGLKDGAFDMIFMHRYPRPEEAIEFFALFRVNVVIYTHPDISIDNLTSSQIASIFSGEITNWSEIGGQDQDIVLYVLPEFDSITQALRAYALGDKPFGASAHLFPDETSVILSATGIAGGVGYGSWGTKKYLEVIDPDTEQQVFHTVSLDGISLDDANYPLSIVLGLGYLPERADYLKPIFDWLTEFLNSSQGQQLLQIFDVTAPREQ